MATETSATVLWRFERDIDVADIIEPGGRTLFEARRVGGCESDPWGYPYDGCEKDGAFIVNCINAVVVAAKRLGMDPAVLAERLKDGGIAELVDAARWLWDCPDDVDADQSLDACDARAAGFAAADAALKLFKKE